MQKYLKNILSDPPHGLGAAANFLLLVSAVLLVSIFFIDPKEQDITMNLLSQVPTVIKEEAQTQKATRPYEVLYSLVESGEYIEKGDTLFSEVNLKDIATIQDWIASLKAGKFKPLKNMLNLPFVTPAIRKKMIELAEVQTPTKRFDNSRIIELQGSVKRLQESVREYESAIVKFKQLENEYEKAFFSVREEKFEKGLISSAELKKYKKRWDDMAYERKISESKLKGERLALFNDQSELKVLSQRKAEAVRRNQKSDNTFHEADLINSLDAILKSSFVISKYEGTVGKIESLNKLDVGDALLSFVGNEVQSNRSNTLIAEVNSNAAKNVVPGRDLFIYLQDGSRVAGKVVKLAENKDRQFVINTKEELSSVDVDQIIIPSKNENFIEKVMENF